MICEWLKFIYIFVHKLFDGYKQEVESRELVQHCILLSNSLPNKLSTRCNMDAKYDGFKMDKIIEEMKNDGRPRQPEGTEPGAARSAEARSHSRQHGSAFADI